MLRNKQDFENGKQVYIVTQASQTLSTGPLQGTGRPRSTAQHGDALVRITQRTKNGAGAGQGHPAPPSPLTPPAPDSDVFQSVRALGMNRWASFEHDKHAVEVTVSYAFSTKHLFNT